MRRERDSLRYVAAGKTEKGVAIQVPRRSGSEGERERDAREKFAEPGKTRDTTASFDGGRIVVRSPRERCNSANNRVSALIDKVD